MKTFSKTKSGLFAVGMVMILNVQLFAQEVVKQAPAGFDVLHPEIAHGRIDSINYNSTTVGVTRKALVYTPPGYTKTKSTLCYTFCTVLVVMKRNG